MMSRCFLAPKGFEAVNISIEERHINSISKLPRIPKKKETNIQSHVSADLFKSTMYDLIYFYQSV